MTGLDAARKIDISPVRTRHTQTDIDSVVAVAQQYRFINVHVLPCWVGYLADLLKDDDDILPGAPVGFPGGAHKTEIKVLEAQELIADGVGEMDMVLNIGKLRNHDYQYVLDEIKQVKDIAGDIPLKVIIEINSIDDYQMIKACDLVVESGADFIKSGTGWIPGDANLKRLEKIKNHVGDQIKIKAAGGIRTIEELMFLESLGIERFGINLETAISLVQTLEATRV
jgi:deoxyribose-phosphate aldolase